MSQVTGTVTLTGNYVLAACWVRAPKLVDLTDKSADVPAGRYELEWEFMGDSGATFECSVQTADGQTAKISKQTLGPGQIRVGSGRDKPPGYQPVMFNVP